MGGSSSKGMRSRSKSIARDNSRKSKNPKSMKKVKAKGKSRKDSAQWTKVDDEVTFVAGYSRSDSSSSMVGPAVPRPRAKSLRFGDFQHLDRVHKVDDTEFLPVDIAFFQEGKVQPEELCHVCSVYTGCETLVCGVCYRLYHQGCLSKIGQWTGPPDLLTSASGIWTCHQCSNLGNLLTEEEVIRVLKRLDKCNIRREDDLSLTDYLAYCHMSLQDDDGKVLTREKAENARRRFAQVQPDTKSRITWCQFLNIEAVRILSKRNKNALVRILTAPELERARDEFRILDTDMDGRITKATAHEALDKNSRKSGYYPDETMMYIDEDLNQSISWIEFLGDRAIYIIAERPCLRISPLAQSTNRRGSHRSSLSSATSLPVTPVTKTPPTHHGKAVARKVSVTAMSSVPNTPVSNKQTSAIQGVCVFRHSDSAPTGLRSFPNLAALTTNEPREHTHPNSGPASNSPAKKQTVTAGFPILPPSPQSSRPTTHHCRSSSGFVAVKKSDPDFSQSKSNNNCENVPVIMHVHHSDSAAGQRLSGGSDSSGIKITSSGSGSQPGYPIVPPRGESQGHAIRSLQEESHTSAGHHVTSKPPLGSSPHGRAVAGPPYGSLVVRVQKGEYRQTQARSMYLASDSLQVASTFGTVTGDSSTGRRPLSLV